MISAAIYNRIAWQWVLDVRFINGLSLNCDWNSNENVLETEKDECLKIGLKLFIFPAWEVI